MANRLKHIISGKLERPPRIILFGLDGLGKSTFAAGAPSPVFIGTEDGTAQLDVQRMPDINQWEDVIASVEELTTEAHEFRTLVIDTLDWLEPMCFNKVCRDAKKPDIESFSYGRGYTAALDEWRVLLPLLDKLRNTKSMQIILLAHAQVRTFRNPAGDDFDRYEMKMHAKSAGLFREWADIVLFANYEIYTHKDSKDRIRGVGDGSRIIHTEYRPAWDAKNRHGLPATLPLAWSELEQAIKRGEPVSLTQINAEITALIEQADATLQEQARGHVVRCGDDAQKLAKLADWLRAKLQQAA